MHGRSSNLRDLATLYIYSSSFVKHMELPLPVVCNSTRVHTAADGKIVPLQGPLSELPLIIFLN